MQDQGRDTSSSYLIELRKLATQKREHNREDDRVSERRREAGLTRTEHTTGTWGKGEEKARAERQEEHGRDDEIGLGEHETHGARHKAVHEEEDERVEEDGHLVCFAVHELDIFARGSHENTGAERHKKGSGYGDFLRRNIGEHLIYTEIIFNIVEKMVKCSTSHHLFMKTIVINDSPDNAPNMTHLIFIFRGYAFLIRVMFLVTKFDKVAKLTIMFKSCIIQECPDRIPHVPEFI